MVTFHSNVQAAVISSLPVCIFVDADIQFNSNSIERPRQCITNNSYTWMSKHRRYELFSICICPHITSSRATSVIFYSPDDLTRFLAKLSV